MEIQTKPATMKNPPEQYTGDIWLDPIVGPKTEGQRMIVGKVRFAPGARTAWHSHALGQTIHVTEGVALLGSRDGTIFEATPGQTIYTAPGEVHWHGSTPEDFMEHFAMLDAADNPAETTTWFEHVSDTDYHRP
jgi:quercetin dioxygenase-like cupin family protein